MNCKWSFTLHSKPYLFNSFRNRIISSINQTVFSFMLHIHPQIDDMFMLENTDKTKSLTRAKNVASTSRFVANNWTYSSYFGMFCIIHHIYIWNIILVADDSKSKTRSDYLTCGGCHRKFDLSELTKFVQHKMLDCKKESSSSSEGKYH